MLGALEPDSVLMTVDIEERASELSHCLGDPRLKVITGNDLDLGIYSGLDIQGIDFLFVDTDHTNEQASKEWSLYKPLLSRDAIAVFDDITMNDMGQFWESLECEKLETGGVFHYTGFGLVSPNSYGTQKKRVRLVTDSASASITDTKVIWNVRWSDLGQPVVHSEIVTRLQVARILSDFASLVPVVTKQQKRSWHRLQDPGDLSNP